METLNKTLPQQQQATIDNPFLQDQPPTTSFTNTFGNLQEQHSTGATANVVDYEEQDAELTEEHPTLAGFLLDTDPDKFIEMQESTLIEAAAADEKKAREEAEAMMVEDKRKKREAKESQKQKVLQEKDEER